MSERPVCPKDRKVEEKGKREQRCRCYFGFCSTIIRRDRGGRIKKISPPRFHRNFSKR